MAHVIPSAVDNTLATIHLGVYDCPAEQPGSGLAADRGIPAQQGPSEAANVPAMSCELTRRMSEACCTPC